jgi:hypothetical protein
MLITLYLTRRWSICQDFSETEKYSVRILTNLLFKILGIKIYIGIRFPIPFILFESRKLTLDLFIH